MDNGSGLRKPGEVLGRPGDERMAEPGQRDMGVPPAEDLRGVDNVVLCRPRPRDQNSEGARI